MPEPILGQWPDNHDLTCPAFRNMSFSAATIACPAFWTMTIGNVTSPCCVKLDTGCKLHAYVLMDNHVHLLVSPPAIGAIGRFMQKLGRGYVGQFNARHRRTGTLWEGRYKANLVDSESHVLHCQRYIDLNPVRARMTDDPAEYPWSSCPAHCSRRSDAMLTPHPAYTALASGPEARLPPASAALSDDDLTAIRTYLQQQRALGRDDFRAMVEAKTQRCAGIRPAYRPPRCSSNGCK